MAILLNLSMIVLHILVLETMDGSVSIQHDPSSTILTAIGMTILLTIIYMSIWVGTLPEAAQTVLKLCTVVPGWIWMTVDVYTLGIHYDSTRFGSRAIFGEPGVENSILRVDVVIPLAVCVATVFFIFSYDNIQLSLSAINHQFRRLKRGNLQLQIDRNTAIVKHAELVQLFQFISVFLPISSAHERFEHILWKVSKESNDLAPAELMKLKQTAPSFSHFLEFQKKLVELVDKASTERQRMIADRDERLNKETKHNSSGNNHSVTRLDQDSNDGLLPGSVPSTPTVGDPKGRPVWATYMITTEEYIKAQQTGLRSENPTGDLPLDAHGNIDLQKCLGHPAFRLFFRYITHQRFDPESLSCLLAIYDFQKIEDTATRNKMAVEIYQAYIHVKSETRINIQGTEFDEVYDLIKGYIDNGRSVPQNMFAKVQQRLSALIRQNYLPGLMKDPTTINILSMMYKLPYDFRPLTRLCVTSESSNSV
jgi:hypothetical protein